jgi:exopolysaccharide biosynthesis polyprenyl glycosylphosphotransferase
VKTGSVGLARRARWVSVPLVLLVVALVIWLAQSTHFHLVSPAALMAVAGIGVMAAALIAEAPRLPRSSSGSLLEEEPVTPERTRVLIVGASESAQRAAREIESSGEHEVIGYAADGSDGVPDCMQILGGTDDIPFLVRRFGVQKVVVAEAPAWQQRLDEMAGDGGQPVDVHVVPGLYEARVGRLRFHTVRDLPLVDLAPADPSRIYVTMKRIGDVLLATGMLVLTAPAMALAALAVKLTSHGPVMFRQERVTRGGRSFTIFKLRTMVVDAEKHTGPVLSSGKADARITPIGKLLRATRLDELPQLFNVLRGEMSLVGPRPERPCFVEQYEEEISGYRERHQVLPGITGLAQVHGGYAIDAEMKLRYDLLYIYNWSPWLDLKIMFQTLATVVRRTGQ